MRIKIKDKTKNQLISLLELTILVVSIVAFSWMIGAEFKVVSADAIDCSSNGGACVSGKVCPSGQTQATLPDAQKTLIWCSLETGKEQICCKAQTKTTPKSCTGSGGYCDFNFNCKYGFVVGSFSECSNAGKFCCKYQEMTTQTTTDQQSGGNWLQTALGYTSLGQQTIGGVKWVGGLFKKNNPAVTEKTSVVGGNILTQPTATTGGDVFNYNLGVRDTKDFANFLQDQGNGYTYQPNGQITDKSGKVISQAKANELISKYDSSLKNGWIDNLFHIDRGTTAGRSLSGALYSALYSAIALTLYVYLFKSIIHASDRNMAYITNTWALLGAGTFGVVIGTIVGKLSTMSGSNAGLIGAAAAIVFMVVYTFAGYQEYSQETFTYTASAWQPVTGGQNCEKCNKLRYGCSEYQCESFGSACNLTNVGTKNEMCVWRNKGDMQGPEIKPIDSVLDANYFYQPSNAVAPPDKGVKIIYKGPDKDANFCIPVFTDLTLGVSTNEPAHCKIDVVKQKNLSEMISEMSEGYVYIFNHTLVIPSSAVPSQSAVDNENLTDDNQNNFTINAGQDRTFYIRCEDFNGNPSPYNFLMQFCVQTGPDTTAPIIKGTNYLSNNSYISFNSQQAYLQVYTNEPADCRWDFQDMSYENMLYNMSKCSQKLSDFLIPSTLTYGCETNLTGIKNEQDNNYFIRCKDQPWLKKTQNEIKRNANKVSYQLTLKGTSDLAIENVSVNSKTNNSVIKDSANMTQIVLRVDTAGGAEDGKAKCQYQVAGNWNFFYNDGGLDYIPENSQKLWLEPGAYNYPIRCVDIGGNMAYNSVGFTVQQDVYPPAINRVYYEEGKIKIITDEEAECVYSITGCNYQYSDGAQMTTQDNLNHFIDWTTNTDLFIKCKDMFGNKPLYDKCSLIVRGSQY